MKQTQDFSGARDQTYYRFAATDINADDQGGIRVAHQSPCRLVHLQLSFFSAPFTVALDDQTRAAIALPSPLIVMRVTITHTHHSAWAIGLIDVRAVYTVEVENHDIATFGRHRHRVFQLVFRRIEVRSAGRAIGKMQDMRDLPAFMRASQKADFAVFVEGVVEMHQRIDKAAVSMFVKGVILVHGEGMPRLRRLDVHGCVVQFDAGFQ